MKDWAIVVSRIDQGEPGKDPGGSFSMFHCVNNSTMDERGIGWPYLLPWHDCGESFSKLLI